MFINKQSLVIHGLTASISAVSLSSLLFLGYITSEINAIIQSAKVVSGPEIDDAIASGEGTQDASPIDIGLCVSNTVRSIQSGARTDIWRWKPKENMFSSVYESGDKAKVITRLDLTQIQADCTALIDLHQKNANLTSEDQENLTTAWAQACVFSNLSFSRFKIPISNSNRPLKDTNYIHDPLHQGATTVSQCYSASLNRFWQLRQNADREKILKEQRAITLG